MCGELVLILTVEPFRGWVTFRAIGEGAHPGFHWSYRKSSLKSKEKLQSQLQQIRKMFRIFILAFVFETRISFPLCNAGWEWVCGELLIFLSGVCECACVSLCSSLLFLLQTCILVFRPTGNVTTPWIKMRFSLRDSSSVGKQTLPHEICPLMTSGPWWGSARGQWCQVRVYSTSWPDSSRHLASIFSEGFNTTSHM